MNHVWKRGKSAERLHFWLSDAPLKDLALSLPSYPLFSTCGNVEEHQKNSPTGRIFSHKAIYGKCTVAINILKYLRTRP